jgi:hypothetical protein
VGGRRRREVRQLAPPCMFQQSRPDLHIMSVTLNMDSVKAVREYQALFLNYLYSSHPMMSTSERFVQERACRDIDGTKRLKRSSTPCRRHTVLTTRWISLIVLAQTCDGLQVELRQLLACWAIDRRDAKPNLIGPMAGSCMIGSSYDFIDL